MAKLHSTRPRREGYRLSARARAVAGCAVLLAAICACDVRRKGADPIEECTTFAASAQACLGDRVATQLRASFEKPPEGEAERAALRAQCAEQNTQLRSTCR